MDNVEFHCGLSIAGDGRAVFRGTPFVESTAPLNQSGLWMRWGNYMVVDAYADVESELSAVRNGVAMGDMSPLAKYQISGDQAAELLERLIPRKISDLNVDQIYYSPWCNEGGYVVGDGLIIRENDTSFLVSADPGLRWWTSNAQGMEIAIADITDDFGILTLQGPHSFDTLSAATQGEFQELPFSRLGWVSIAGHSIRIIRQGFTGEHGFELWVPRELGPTIWNAVEDAGADFRIVPAGSWALDVARLEAGLLIVGYDYSSAGPDEGAAGVYASSELNSSPFDLGLGRLIDFEKTDFCGRTSLNDIVRMGSNRNLVGLEIDCAKFSAIEPGNLRRVRWHHLDCYKSGQRVGFATSVAWSPTLQKLIGFGHLTDKDLSVGDSVSLCWPMNDRNISVLATLHELPFYKLKRSL